MYDRDFNINGYKILKDIIDPELCAEIINKSLSIFSEQTHYLQLEPCDNPIESLYNNDYKVFLNCAKHCQWIPELHQLGLNLIPVVQNILNSYDINICTRPVLYFNNINTSKNKYNHTVDSHQDYKSMQGSNNSIVIWVPLIDIPLDFGPLQIIPGSHKLGDIAKDIQDGFGYVDTNEKFITTPLNRGDALLFSSFLIHKSGTIKPGLTRWSCHFRYNDMSDFEFIKKGYPHPYEYKPVKI